MWYLAIGIFLVQALAMVVDELHYHRRRGLGRWERIGHPVDTCSVLVCYSFPWLLPVRSETILLYCACAVGSSLLVTKDEAIHAKECLPGELWVHAVLFIVHPVLLILVGLFWLASAFPSECTQFARLFDGSWSSSLAVFRPFFAGQCGLTVAALCYQIGYWNFVWKPPVTSPPKPE
ncbi:MAG: hypothetical protein K1Y36_29085 [Blastocatellia bacterium]|nr:hypothetical protein [Blastocatellia bacterium]